MEAFVGAVRGGEWRGYTGERITDIVNIGVGAFDAGPHMVAEALRPYGAAGPLQAHFVSNVDGSHLIEVLKRVRAESTLFVVASKGFSSHEISLNALSAKMWFLENAQHCCDSVGGESAVLGSRCHVCAMFQTCRYFYSWYLVRQFIRDG